MKYTEGRKNGYDFQMILNLQKNQISLEMLEFINKSKFDISSNIF